MATALWKSMDMCEGYSHKRFQTEMNLHARYKRDFVHVLGGGWRPPLSHIQRLVDAVGELTTIPIHWLASVKGYVQVRKHSMDVHACLLTCK